MTDRIESYIDQNRNRFIDELKEWMRFPSVSAQRDHDKDTRACAGWLVDHLKNLGFKASLVDIGGQPIVRASKKGMSQRCVMIYGHYDVQPEDPIDQWQTPPFEPTIRDGILYGRGATDDKGQVFTHVKAVESLLKTEGQLPCEVVFLLEGEEESGGDALGRYVTQVKDELRPDAIVISDTTMYDEKTPALTYGLRGIIAFEFIVKGPGADVHSGAYGGAISNPAMTVAQILAQCVSPEGKVLIPHFYDDVAPLEKWESDMFRKLAFNEKALMEELNVPGLHGEGGFSTLERLWARPTFEVNGIFGGYMGEGPKTVLPAWAGAKVSMRLVPNQNPEKIAGLFEAFINSIKPDTVKVTVKAYDGAFPSVVPIVGPSVEAATRAVTRAFGKAPVFTREGGSIPVVSTFKKVLGLDTILIGFGQNDDNAHSPNEKFSLEDYQRGILTSAHLLQEMAR